METIFGLPIATLIFAGLFIKSVGFMVRDELVLRALVVTGICLDLSYYLLRPEPIIQSAIANAVLIAVNSVILVTIAFERTTLRMSPAERELFQAFPTLYPGHFRRVLKVAEWKETATALDIARQDEPLDRFYYVMGPDYEITKDGQTFPMRGPAFVGEIAFLTGRPSSATVSLPAGTRYVAFSSGRLHARMERSLAFKNAIVALFAEDLALKVARSVPVTPGTAPSPRALTEQPAE